MKKKMFSLMTVFLLVFQIFIFSGRVSAGGIPVFDGVNLGQSIMQVIEAIMQNAALAEQYAKQIQEYQTQLQQLEDQIRNSVAPAAYIWSQVETTLNEMQALQNKVQAIYDNVGGLEAYLAKYGDINYYKNSPEFGKHGVNNWLNVTEADVDHNEFQKESNDAMAKIINDQIGDGRKIETDAKGLKKIKKGIPSAEGRMAAIQYGNQLAALTNDQLIQLRMELLTMHQALFAKMQAEQDEKTREIAATEKFMSGEFEKVRDQPYQDFPTFSIFK